MPAPTSITDLSTTASSNGPAGSETPDVLDDYARAHAAFIAQLHSEKAPKATPTFTGTVTAPDLRATSSFRVGDNAKMSISWSLTGAGTITTNLPYGAAATSGGGLLIITGSDSGGQPFCAVYAVATSMPSTADSVTSALIVRQGASTPSITIAGSGSSTVSITIGATGANLTYAFGVGF